MTAATIHPQGVLSLSESDFCDATAAPATAAAPGLTPLVVLPVGCVVSAAVVASVVVSLTVAVWAASLVVAAVVSGCVAGAV